MHMHYGRGGSMFTEKCFIYSKIHPKPVLLCPSKVSPAVLFDVMIFDSWVHFAMSKRWVCLGSGRTDPSLGCVHQLSFGDYLDL